MPFGPDAARKQILVGGQAALLDPVRDCRASLLRNLEWNWPAGLSLQHHGPAGHLAAVGHIHDPESDEIAASQLAVDGQVE